MEEENKNSDESAPKKRSKAAGIGIGLAFGIALEIVTILLFSSGWVLFMAILYIALVILFYAKGEENIGCGLILAFCISLLVFGGCLVVLF